MRRLNRQTARWLCGWCGWAVVLSGLTVVQAADEWPLQLRYRQPTSEGSQRFHTLTRSEDWDPAKTAIIVCDMWDLHHCLNAVRREQQFAPRLNEVLKFARQRGATIIHAPSGCMDTYADHPARQRAVDTPLAANLPADIGSWCSQIPAEEQGKYPIDQSDGGEDDDPQEHAEWAAKLEKMGRNPRAPWKSQIDVIDIDSGRDFISDRGEEVWSILESRGIDHVILTGVHTNMCVLGRPFGLRQMSKNGKNVVLMRDLTDTMYNPKMWPFVSHFSGTDLIVEHIEKFVCPTISSEQLLGGQAFRFENDRRPHLAIVMAEDEYETETTLPPFAAEHLASDFRISLVYGSNIERNEIPGLDVLDQADAALISIRRRLLKPEQMEIVRRFVAAGKPMLGIRTASHAFSLRNEPAPAELAAWETFDADVWGGNYTNHHGNKLTTTVQMAADQPQHPILAGVTAEPFVSGGSLYRVSPIASSATVLATGSVPEHPAEPVAWTFTRSDGGRSFYTSLGHKDDFQNPSFVRMLVNAVHWSVKVK